MRDSLGEQFRPFEHVTRVQALRDFVDWLYDVSPEPPSMPRETLLQEYWNRVASESVASGVVARTDYPEPGKLVMFPLPDPA